MGFLWFGKKKKRDEAKGSVIEFSDKLEAKAIENTEAPTEKKDEPKECTPIAEQSEKEVAAPSDNTMNTGNTPVADKKTPVKRSKKTDAAKSDSVAVEKKTEDKTPPTVIIPSTKEEKVTAAEVADTDGGETVTEGRSVASGKFDIKKARDGRYVFNLYAANKVLIATSQIYSSSQSAMTGVKSVMTNAQNAPIEDSTLKNPTVYPFPKWEVYMDKAGEFRFRLYATNGNCICHAKKGYSTKSNCKRAIESIVRFVSEVNIDKSYLSK